MRSPDGIRKGQAANPIVFHENGLIITGTTRNPSIALHFSGLTVDPAPTVDGKLTLLWRNSHGKRTGYRLRFCLPPRPPDARSTWTSHRETIGRKLPGLHAFTRTLLAVAVAALEG